LPAAPGRRSDAGEPLPDNPGAIVARPEPSAAPAGRGRNDAFDPAANPNAPGAPRALGSIASAGPGPMGMAGARPPASPSVGGPGIAAQPLPPARGADAGPQVALVEPPSATPKDEYDLAYGYMLRKDYGPAEQTFRAFLRKYASDRLVPDANYWLGESLFQQKHYRDAAESFLTVTTKYDTSGKAPDSLLRLGQSLAALGEKEAACAALGEVGRKYPRASAGIKQGVDREQKRVHC
jgi:tol-pal system protein YbgF